MRIATHIDELTRRIDLSGRAVVDVGAGLGAFARQMAGKGAEVTAVEIDDDKVAAVAEGAGPGIVALKGGAEAIPLADESADLVTFMFSFHHVPASLHGAAISEAARVLKPGGRLHAADPLPEGALTEVLKPVDDETEVRRRAQAHLAAVADTAGPFRLVEHDHYALRRLYRDVGALIEGLIVVDPARAARLGGARAEVEARFARFGEEVEGGVAFAQPCVMYHFERR